jgi:hypothetical protein
MVTLRRRLRTPSKFFTEQHRGDQRDVTAFVFAANGFNEEAQWTRNSERELSYWAEGDRLTEKVLEAGAPENIRRAIECLKALLNYGAIHDTSELLIHFDIARLAAAIGDKDAAFRHLSIARDRHHPVIETRVKMVPALSALTNETPKL